MPTSCGSVPGDTSCASHARNMGCDSGHCGKIGCNLGSYEYSILSPHQILPADPKDSLERSLSLLSLRAGKEVCHRLWVKLGMLAEAWGAEIGRGLHPALFLLLFPAEDVSLVASQSVGGTTLWWGDRCWQPRAPRWAPQAGEDH